jgi:general nucleoside transport system ATP-binding protein
VTPYDRTIACRGVVKRFGETLALDGADLSVRRGAVHAVVGENGAGKTTLMRIVAGELAADAGEATVRGRVGIVRQQRSIVPELSVLENVVLGAEPTRRGRIDWTRARRRVTDLMARTGLELPLEREAERLPPALQQRCELVGALARGAEVLLLDEPTTLLTPQEVEGLFRVVQELARDGLTVVFISHKLREVADHCDAVTVLRAGRTTARFSAPFELAEVGAAMTGGEPLDGVDVTLGEPTARAGTAATDAPPRLRALLSHELPLTLWPGSVLGLAGVAGNGQDELVAHLAGTAPRRAYGPIELDGVPLDGLDVLARRRLGVRVIPADVSVDGCALDATLVENVLTTEVPRELVGRLGTLRRARVRQHVEQTLARGEVVYARTSQLARELSGGNRQRLVVARELDAGARVVIAHEPTRGVDFAAAAAIRRRLIAFAAGGGAVLVVSSDLEELLAVCNEIAVLYDHRLLAVQPRADITLARLGQQLGGLVATAAGGAR